MSTPTITAPTASRDLALVVDDSPETLSMLIDAIETGGLSALVARDGQTALDLLDRITPDIILLDAMMPGLDGFETCRRIKARTATAGTPVIFITGLSDSSHVLEGLRAGGVDYITKPINPDVLNARIAVHIANARLLEEARGALDVGGRAVAALRPDGGFAWISPRGHELLADATSQQAGVRAVMDWTRTTLQRATSDAEGLCIGDSGTRVRLSAIGRTASGHLLVGIATVDDTPPALRLSRALGITLREAEVLYWLAQGKSNRDIADILGLSPRTVMKHVEQIFVKTHVENRTAAASLCLRHLMA